MAGGAVPILDAPDPLTLLAGDGPGAACDAPDFADVLGQEQVKRALEVAVAGGHNVLLVGPPGSGKTMLARRLPSIMPPFTVPEAIDVTRVYSVAGLLAAGESLVVRRPFRAPHHTISASGLVGGGNTPRPGEVSLAHLGVLFLDEFPEFGRAALEGLRQPLEDGEVTISRALSSVTFPARIMLVAAMNPCPCGFRGDPVRHCTCLQHRLSQYRGRLSGPLLDRIDLRVDVPRLAPAARRGLQAGEPSAAVRARVAGARSRQQARLAAHDRDRQRDTCRPGICAPCASSSPEAVRVLDRAYERLRLSARACDRVTKVAQTIADLEGAGAIGPQHVHESLAYRLSSLDRW